MGALTVGAAVIMTSLAYEAQLVLGLGTRLHLLTSNVSVLHDDTRNVTGAYREGVRNQGNP